MVKKKKKIYKTKNPTYFLLFKYYFFFFFFFFNDTATTEIYTLSLHDALPITTTVGGLLSAIGIAGMDRMIQKNVIAMSGRAVEAAGDVDVLLLDKTGTITL